MATEMDCLISKGCESDQLFLVLVTHQIDDNGSEAGMINKGSALFNEAQLQTAPQVELQNTARQIQNNTLVGETHNNILVRHELTARPQVKLETTRNSANSTRGETNLLFNLLTKRLGMRQDNTWDAKVAMFCKTL